MRKKGFLMLVLLVFLALFGGPASAGESSDAFKDVGNHWAAGDIEKCRALQLMSGYPGGLFMPDRNLSRAEALAVIGRGLGWDRQAESISAESIEYPGDLWEGFRVFVACAADKQLIAKEDVYFIKFNDPATRMELAVWLAKALNLRGKGFNLNFTDLGGIPASEKDMLAGVVEAGIIRGLPGNLFSPSGSVTRAQMAAILARLAENRKLSPSASAGQAGQSPEAVKGERGYVINKYQDYFTVHLDFGKVVKIRVADVSLLINGNKTSYGSLRRGSPVELVKSGSAVTEVRILDGTPKVFGKVVEVESSAIVIKDGDGKTAVYDIGRNVKVIDVNGAETDVEEIIVGLNAELFLGDNEYVREIRLHKSTGRDIQGKLDDVDTSGKKITVIENGKRQSLYLEDSVTVRDGGETLQLDGLKKGMDVRVTIDANSRVTLIEILDLSMVIGKVDYVKTGGQDLITIKERSGQSRTYYVAEGAAVREENKTLELEDLDEGKDVRLTLGGDGRVTNIEVVDLSNVVGRVTAVRAAGTRWIVVETDSGREELYYVEKTAGVREGSAWRGIDFLEENMRVRLALNHLGNVTSIEVTGVQSITGTIAGVQIAGVKKITLKDRSGQARTYQLAGGAVVREGERTLGLNDLKPGMNARVSLDNDGRVVGIEIAGLSVVEGEVTHIRTFGTAKIEIEKNDGTMEAYYLVNGVKVTEGDVARDLRDIVKGVRVRMTLDDRGNVAGIDITGQTTVEGKVTVITGRGFEKIGIVKDDGKEEIYDIDSEVTVREGDVGREPDYIFEGMRVRLTLDNKLVATRIDILGLHTVRGRVTMIRNQDTPVIVLEEAGGKEKTYNISNNATVGRGGSARSLGDVREGMSVELTLDGRLQVVHIEII